MKYLPLAATIVVASFLTGVASAHDRLYVQPMPGQPIGFTAMDCSDDLVVVSIGGFCIPAGDFSDPVTIDITDSVFTLVGARACQVDPASSQCVSIGSFCDTGTFSGVDVTRDLLVFLHGVANGNIVTGSACPGVVSFGTVGTGSHS